MRGTVGVTAIALQILRERKLCDELLERHQALSDVVMCTSEQYRAETDALRAVTASTAILKSQQCRMQVKACNLLSVDILFVQDSGCTCTCYHSFSLLHNAAYL
jgi:hypothetical protein